MITTAEANYRVELKRIIRTAFGWVANDAPTDSFERQIRFIAKAAPLLVARGLSQTYENAKRAWEWGNNSGNREQLTRCEAECDRLRAAADQVMALFNVTVDYPGLYPSFRWEGHEYHSCDSVLRTVHKGNYLEVSEVKK